MKKYTLLTILLASILLITPNFSFGATNVEMQIQAIMAQIQALQKQLSELQVQQSSDKAWCHTFNSNLKIGDIGKEVQALGTALEKEGFGLTDTREGLTAPISDDGVFIESTASAVSGFQQKYKDEILTPVGLKYGTGYVGKFTRAKLNKLYGCEVTKPPASAGYLEIEPSSASLAVGGSVSMQAMYQPPMPKCPEGFACPQVMPARYPVAVSWTSSNSSIATVMAKPKGCGPYPTVTTCADYTTGVVSGVSVGTADIKASYKSLSGTILTAIAKITVDSGTLAPSITVISPNGGESWKVGGTYLIRWTASGIDTVDVILSNSTGYGEIKVTTQYSAVTGTYSWTIPSSVSPRSDYKIRIEGGPFFEAKGARQYLDESNAPFSIVAAVVNPAVAKITLLSPSLGPVGTKVTISGSGFTATNNVNFAGGTIMRLSSSDSRTLSFFVPQIVSPPVKCPAGATCPSPPSFEVVPGIYNVSVENSFGLGSSNVLTFTVTGVTQTPPITVLSPNGGEVWQVGQTYDIKWNQTRAGTVTIGLRNKQLSGSGGSGGLWYIIGEFSGSAGVNTYKWTLSSGLTYSGGYEVQIDGSIISEAGRPILGSDTSNAPFSIAATLGNVPAGASIQDGDQNLATALVNMKTMLDQMQEILKGMAR